MSTSTRSTFTTSGTVVVIVLVLAVAISPVLLVLTPLIPISCLIFIQIRKAALGTAWKVLWWVSWGVMVVCCWPFLGLDVYVA